MHLHTGTAEDTPLVCVVVGAMNVPAAGVGRGSKAAALVSVRVAAAMA